MAANSNTKKAVHFGAGNIGMWSSVSSNLPAIPRFATSKTNLKSSSVV